MVPGDRVMSSAAIGELDGGASPVTGLQGRFGRGAEEPHRLVARVPAPGHRPRRDGGSPPVSSGSAARAAASSNRCWASLGSPRAKVSRARCTASSWASARRVGLAGRPAERSP